MPPAATTLDAIDESGCGLRVTFVWHRDRFAHTIALIDDGRITPLLASQEGVDQDAWPPSPPLRNLTIEPRGDSHQVALLVGMAGTSHWSLSVEADGSRRELIFDVACRVKETPQSITSSFRTMAKPDLRDQGTSAAFDNGVSIQIETAAEFSATTITESPAGLHIAAAHENKFPTTIRWRYSISRVNQNPSPRN